MKFGIFHRAELTGVSTWIVEELEKAYSAIGGTWNVEHRDGGQHAHVTVDSIRERGRSVAMGVPITPTFRTADFRALGGMTWSVTSGDINVYSYWLIGTVLYLSFDIQTSTVAGVVSQQLQLAIPGGFVATSDAGGAGWAEDNGVATSTVLVVTAATDYVAILRTDNANWTAAANTTRVLGQIAIHVG
jgi:hypothetical protein